MWPITSCPVKSALLIFWISTIKERLCLLIVCLGFSSYSRFFSHRWRLHHYRWILLQTLTYARDSWPLSNEDSLTWHIYCDMVQPFIMVIFEDPWHLHLKPGFWQWSCRYLFEWLVFVLTSNRSNRTPISRMRGECSTFWSPRRAMKEGRKMAINNFMSWLHLNTFICCFNIYLS